MHYHLDPIGGIAGDMFAAAMLDCHREWKTALTQSIQDSGLAVDLGLRALEHNDGILTGHRFEITEPQDSDPHQHRQWRDIRHLLSHCRLDTAIKRRALAIFQLLAEAEAEVHGCAVEDVAFHEVGAWDSIADIVTAAWLIERSGAASWSCATIPMGRGRVSSSHGWLPVPAPATAILLKGCPLYDDGIEGERVTPTGAAILKHLEPSFGARETAATLRGQGYGFGTKTLPGLSNVLRISAFDPVPAQSTDTSIVVCQFEVDDQTPEDLAVGLERLRELHGVLDVTQAPVFGKKGRLAMHIQVLGQVSCSDEIIEHCLTETTTLGVRWHVVNRKTLARNVRKHRISGENLSVKRASRPAGNVTRKVEMRDLARTPGGHAGREQRRQEVCARDLEKENEALTYPESEQ